MKKPELLLSNLNRVALELRGAIGLLEDQELNERLSAVIRRLFMAELLSKESVIAICGSQGAGKTTLLQLMYGLENNQKSPENQWLPANAGRGECLPVLVLEDESLDHAMGFVRVLESRPDYPDRFRISEQPVSSPAEFRRATSGERDDVLLPVLKLPRTYFKETGQAFLLLPGYEPQHAENESWQILMRQALVEASACIVVTDQTRLANAQQRDILKDLQSSLLAGVQPIIVISKTENIKDNPEQQRELRQTAAEVFEISEAMQEDFILCTGSSPENIAQWKPRLVSAIGQLSMGSALNRERQLDHLEKLLNQDLNQVLAEINMKLTLQKGQSDAAGLDIKNDILDTFDRARDRLRAEYMKNVKDSLQAHLSQALPHLNQKLIADHEGFKNKASKFFDTVGEKRQKLMTDINTAWSSPGRYANSHIQVLGAITAKKLGRDGSQPLLLASDSRDVPTPKQTLAHLGYLDEKGGSVAWKEPCEETRSNLAIIFYPPPDNEEVQNIEAKKTGKITKKFKESIQLLPALTLEFARVSSLFPQNMGIDPSRLTILSDSNGVEAAQRIHKDFSELHSMHSDVVKGMAVILAIDGAADGKIDTIPALFGALGLGGGGATGGGATRAAAAAGTTLAGAATALVAIGLITYSVLQEVSRQDTQARDMAYGIMETIREQHLAHYIEHFDTMMDSVRNKMEDCLARRYKLDENLMRRERLVKALADMTSLKLDLVEELGSGRAYRFLTA